MNSSFWQGFVKEALWGLPSSKKESENNEKESENNEKESGEEKKGPNDTWKKLIVPGVAAGVGLGTYLLKRRSKKGYPSKVVRDVYSADFRKEDLKGLKKHINNFLYGADELVVTPKGRFNVATKPNVEGMLYSSSPAKAGRYLGTEGHVLGKTTPTQLDRLSDKKFEQMEINKYFPEGAVPTVNLTARHKGITPFHRVHTRLTEGGDKYFIKGLAESDTGVGGKGFISSLDMEKYFTNAKKLPNKKIKRINYIFDHPKEFMVQKDIKVLKSPITKNPSEFRVHTLDGQVFPGGTVPRAGNAEDIIHVNKVQKFYQDYLDSLPEAVKRKRLPQSADVALTEDGLKIIETNTGADSGLLDVYHMWKRYKNESKIKALLGAAIATRGNLGTYKILSGREHIVPAAAKSVGAAGLTYAGGRYLEKKKAPETEPKELPKS